MKVRLAAAALAALIAAPLASAQVLSWDPLKDIRQALPGGVPHEGSVIEARHQVREMANDALASL